jgi:hypothetical protein
MQKVKVQGFLCLCLLAGAAGYSLSDPDADHFSHAIEMDEAGDAAAAIASFRAAAKFAPDNGAYGLFV